MQITRSISIEYYLRLPIPPTWTTNQLCVNHICSANNQTISQAQPRAAFGGTDLFNEYVYADNFGNFYQPKYSMGMRTKTQLRALRNGSSFSVDLKGF